jgi:hypothetical protein
MDASAPPRALPQQSKLLQVLGPGLITGASDDDPSGIATYSQVGAQFGGAPPPPGRSLELRSNAWPRGMTVLQHSCCGQNSAYRSGCHKVI